MADMCGDNRFEIIGKAKKHLLEATNIETSEDEMKVLDSILFRCWQMGWLNKYDNTTKYISEKECGDCDIWKRMKAYENADLIERSEVIKTANNMMLEAYNLNDKDTASAFNAISIVVEVKIPRFNPEKGDSDD